MGLQIRTRKKNSPLNLHPEKVRTPQMAPGARSREISAIWGVLGIIFIGLQNITSRRLEPDQHDTHKVDVIALYYGSIVPVTTLAILAIDFPVVFPLEWRKTEEFGLRLLTYVR